MALEVWLPVAGYEGHYEVSSFGRVRSIARTRKGKGGSPVAVRERILSTHGLMGSGYPAVSLSAKRSVYVHRLVAAAFIPNPDMRKAINHIDGDKKNPAADNLEWTTHRDNARHASRLGLLATGERHGRYTKPEAFNGR